MLSNFNSVPSTHSWLVYKIFSYIFAREDIDLWEIGKSKVKQSNADLQGWHNGVSWGQLPPKLPNNNPLAAQYEKWRRVYRHLDLPKIELAV